MANEIKYYSNLKKPDELEERKSKDQIYKLLEKNGYKVDRSIGSGAYATVKIAYSKRYECVVAIKIISKIEASSHHINKFLTREIEVVKGLKHKNLIKYYQAIETTHRVYIIMEYAENGSLLNIIKKDSYIDEERARKWFKELVSAVEYCHKNGVVHRDIKCENILMNTSYNIKLCDFGFARGNMLTEKGQMKFSKTFCGSYAYASPEILKGKSYQPNNSDIWSMGVVLYAMIFGILPFDDSNYPKLIKQVQNKITFPENMTVSEECKKLITKMLSPLEVRISISKIKKEPWYQQS